MKYESKYEISGITYKDKYLYNIKNYKYKNYLVVNMNLF